MLLHIRLRKCQPQSRASFPAGNQWQKNSVTNVRGYSRSIVNDMQFQCQFEPLPCNRYLTDDSRAEIDPAIAVQSLRGIAGKIEQDLGELLMIGTYLRKRNIVIAHHFKPVGELGQQQGANMLADLVHIKISQVLRLAVGNQQSVDQPRQAIDFGHDDLCAFGERRPFQLYLQQLCGAADAA